MKSKSEDAESPVAHPKDATELYGHQGAEGQLQQWWQAGRLPHALLISGAKGIGKATLAHRFARNLLSSHVEDETEKERIARRVIAGSHSDFLSLELGFDEKKKEYRKEIVIADTRQVSEFLSLTPGEGNWRVVIIDAADDMNRNAANALLKIIEEPPSHAVLMLVSHNPGSLLPTIRSRCRMLKMATPGFGTFQRIVQNVYPHLLSKELMALFALSGGSAGVALHLHHSEGMKLYARLVELLGQLPLRVLSLHELADHICGKDTERWTLFSHLIQVLLNRLAKAAAQGEVPQELVAGEAEMMQKLLSLQPLAYWLLLWSQSGQLLADTDRLNLDRRQSLFNVMQAMEGTSLEVARAG